MPPKKNPLKLNALQLRTLAILQYLAGLDGHRIAGSEPELAGVANFPLPHGDHFHIGEFVVMRRNASGLANEAVWRALERKGLAKPNYPLAIFLTEAGQAYDTGVRDKVLIGTNH